MKNKTIEFQVGNLKLRKFKLNDYKDMFNNWASDEDVAKGAGWPKHENIEKTKSLVNMWVDEYKEDNTLNWIIELESVGAIGSITVVRKNLYNRVCEIGYNIGKKYWNNGYASLAIKTIVKYLFELDLFDTITAQCFEYNTASIKVLEKNGFKKDGILRNRYMLDGKQVNLVDLSLIRADID